MLGSGRGGGLLTRMALLTALLLALPAVSASAAPDETASPQVYYGQPAAEDEYPFAAFVSTPIGSCTGSLVASNKVLTAGHCVFGDETLPVLFRVTLGSHDYTSPSATEYAVTNIDLHEDYDPETLEHDVAMLTLAAAAPEVPVRLIGTSASETSLWEPGDTLRIAGWGMTEDDPEPEVMEEADVPRIDDDTCDQRLDDQDPPLGPIDRATMVCAGDGMPGAGNEAPDTCQGDSGGPLLAHDGTAYALVGATSWGGDCGEGPGVYARLGADPLNEWAEVRLTGGPPPPTAPPNDRFEGATGMSGTFDSVLGQNNVGATKQGGEPDHAGENGGASVWYTWTAPATGNATVDTCDGDFDTLIGVYTGTAVNTLTTVAEDDDSCIRPGGSFAGFTAQAGLTYHFAVDGFGGDTGNFDIYVELTPTSGGGAGDAGAGGSTPPPPGPPPATGASAGNDTLFGNAGGNVICGLAGSDLIRGGRGNDTIFGDQCGARSRLSARAAAAGDGNDRLFGDAGNDRLFGSGRHDRLFGGPGNDLLVGGRGRDSLSGGGGRDTINSRDRARDIVNCGPGRDTVRRDRRDRVRGCERVRR